MTKTPIQPKRIVLKTNRDTVILVAGAVAATLALAASIHARAPEEPTVVTQAPQQDWTGELADIVQTSTDTAVSEPLTSASLTVPKSAVALPNAAVRPRAKPCEGPACRVAGIHGQVAHSEAARVAQKDRGLMARLNPLNHLDTLQKPFVYAGNTISSWLRSF